MDASGSAEASLVAAMAPTDDSVVASTTSVVLVLSGTMPLKLSCVNVTMRLIKLAILRRQLSIAFALRFLSSPTEIICRPLCVVVSESSNPPLTFFLVSSTDVLVNVLVTSSPAPINGSSSSSSSYDSSSSSEKKVLSSPYIPLRISSSRSFSLISISFW